MDAGYCWRLKNSRAAAFLISSSLLYAHLSFQENRKARSYLGWRRGQHGGVERAWSLLIPYLPLTVILGTFYNFSESQWVSMKRGEKYSPPRLAGD